MNPFTDLPQILIGELGRTTRMFLEISFLNEMKSNAQKKADHNLEMEGLELFCDHCLINHICKIKLTYECHNL